jgi:hypothetical protein
MRSETVLRRYLQEFGRHAQEFSIGLATEYAKDTRKRAPNGERRALDAVKLIEAAYGVPSSLSGGS